MTEWHRLFALLGIALAAAALGGLACTVSPPAGGVDVLTARGDVSPAIANYLKRGITQANDQHAHAVVIMLDTPGGLDSSMRDIVQAIDASRVPVIVYVAPSGARAASAGTFITLAGHVAAMAPNTAIGAAHPVGAGGQDISGTLAQKVENDAVAYIRSMADLRGRNADWAEQAVRQSVSASETQALQLHVVDEVAPSLDVLLGSIDGRTVRLNDGQLVTLATAGQPIYPNPMSGFEQFLLLISDPNIAFLLLAIGGIALVVELYHGTLVLGVIGAVSLIIGLLSLGSLPVNWAGVALLGLAVVLIAAELLVGSYGLLALAGLVALGAGGLLLTSTSNPHFQVSRSLVVAVPLVVGAALGGVTLFALNAKRRAIAVGAEALIGAAGVATATLDPLGQVIVHGERWQAQADQPIREGEGVIVTGRTGLRLTVERAARTDSENPGQGDLP